MFIFEFIWKGLLMLLFWAMLTVSPLIDSIHFRHSLKLDGLPGEVAFEKSGNIYIIQADGANKRTVYNHPPANAVGGPGTDYGPAIGPRWSSDKSRVEFAASVRGGSSWVLLSVDARGGNLRMLRQISGRDDWMLARNSRADDITVRRGSVFYRSSDGVLHEVYRKYLYDADYNSGAAEASWGPEKQQIIFEDNNRIFIADLRGSWAELTPGAQPDWK